MDDLILQLVNLLRTGNLGRFEEYQRTHGENKYAFIMSVRGVTEEAVSRNDYRLLRTAMDAGRYVVSKSSRCGGIDSLENFLDGAEHDLQRLANTRMPTQYHAFAPSQISVATTSPGTLWVAPPSLALQKILPTDEEIAAQLYIELNNAHTAKRPLSYIVNKSENELAISTPYQRSKILMGLVTMRQLSLHAPPADDLDPLADHFLQLLSQDRS